MNYLVWLLTVSVLISCGQNPATPPKETLQYYGYGSSEAKMTFDFHVEIESTRKPTKAQIDEAIENQVSHLFGTMAAASSVGVPKTDHTITGVSVPRLKDGEGKLYLVDYTYEGTIVLKNGPKTQYEVVLPYNPETIYSFGMVGNKNRCTDDHYNGEGDFWYFWNPDQAGCPLQDKEGVYFDRIQASIERLPNTKLTHPEFERLVRERNGKETIDVMLLLGMDDAENAKNPLISKDINASIYRKLRNDLVKSGFETRRPWTKRQMSDFVGTELNDKVHVEEFTKQMGDVQFVVRMFFGPSGIDEDSTAFHWFFKKALEDSSILMYDGHSGLGGHLDLRAIEEAEGFKIQPDKQNYQIYFFDSCSSYPYYNTMYFQRKKSSSDLKGTKNLEIITNGLSTPFSAGFNNNREILHMVMDWAENNKRTSYQELLKKIGSGDLMGVNGDEDND